MAAPDKLHCTRKVMQIGVPRTTESLSRALLSSLGDALVSWASKKQSTIALSTTEAEMIAMSEAARERLCLSNLCKSLGETPQI